MTFGKTVSDPKTPEKPPVAFIISAINEPMWCEIVFAFVSARRFV